MSSANSSIPKIAPPWPILKDWKWRTFKCDCGMCWVWPMGKHRLWAGEHGGPPPGCPMCGAEYFVDVTPTDD